MQTHRDDDHAWKKLEEEAQRATEAGENEITAGSEGERPLQQWTVHHVMARHLPERPVDAELGLTRVSVGGIVNGEAYLVFRGPPDEARILLTRALNALRRQPKIPTS